jgi:hypothetical protein
MSDKVSHLDKSSYYEVNRNVSDMNLNSTGKCIFEESINKMQSTVSLIVGDISAGA